MTTSLLSFGFDLLPLAPLRLASHALHLVRLLSFRNVHTVQTHPRSAGDTDDVAIDPRFVDDFDSLPLYQLKKMKDQIMPACAYNLKMMMLVLTVVDCVVVASLSNSACRHGVHMDVNVYSFISHQRPVK
jgi:predicted nuclease with RNAse H fold